MVASIVMSLAVAWTTTPPPGLLISTYTGFGATIVGLIEGAVVLAFWNRMEWSRTAVVVFSVLWLATVIWTSFRLIATHSLGSALADGWEFDPSFMLLVAAKILLFTYLLISLNTRIARAWFTRRANFKSQQA
jgi:antibiotic biosynthesis monooxygenase (ABM) superfamily enzyme